MDDNKWEKDILIEDPRFKQCDREAIMGFCIGIVNLIWWFAWGYGLGSQPISEYTYVLGFPMWFFMSCIVGSILFSIITVIMINKFFKNMSLEALSEDEVEQYRKEYK